MSNQPLKAISYNTQALTAMRPLSAILSVLTASLLGLQSTGVIARKPPQHHDLFVEKCAKYDILHFPRSSAASQSSAFQQAHVEATLALGDLDLEQARNNRFLMGNLMHTFLLPTTAQLDPAIKTTASAKNSPVQSEIASVALVSALCTTPETPQTKDSLIRIRRLKSDEQSWAQHVDFCTVVDCHDNIRQRVQWWLGFALAAEEAALTALLLQMGASLEKGPPPRFRRERIAGQKLSALRAFMT